jgi:DNA-binding MarR family transcriptional regulator
MTMVDDEPVTETGTEGAATAAAVREVEEQMSVLAGHIRASLRDAALAIDPTLQPFGLKLLRTLTNCGPIHSSAVADLLMTDRSVVSRQVRQLEDLGLIELQPDPADRRARFLAVTPLATQRLKEARVNDKVMLHSQLATWSAADLHQFAAFIARLNSPGA